MNDGFTSYKLKPPLRKLNRTVRILHHLGSRAFMRFQQEFSVLSDLAYFCATTLSGRLTLGEEYCDIIPIHQASGTPPSASRRWTLILLQVASPYLFEKLLVLLRHLKAARGMAAGVGVGALTADHVGLAAVSHLATVSLISLRQFITGQLRSIHLAIFYFVGSYYHFSKRLLGIRYIFNRQRRPGEETVGYELLGVLILLQLFTRWFLDARKRALAQQDLSLSSIASTGEMASEGDTTITTATVDQLQQQQQHPDFIE